MALAPKKAKKKTVRKVETPTGKTAKSMAAKAAARRRKRDTSGRFS